MDVHLLLYLAQLLLVMIPLMMFQKQLIKIEQK